MEKLIKVSFDVVTEESAMDGDTAENGWEDENGIDMMPDEFDIEDGKDCIDLAIEFLKDKVIEPSSSHFHPGIWYSSESEQDMFDGSYKTLHYHLEGFTEDEEKEIFDLLFPEHNRR